MTPEDYIRLRRDTLETEEADAYLAYIKVKERIEQELKALQKICKHTETKYCPDPSGNSDWSYECLLCGKEAKRL